MALSKEVLAALKAPATTPAVATDTLVEYVGGRKAKGTTLFQISVELMEMLQESPPDLDSAFDRARALTFLPGHQDLTAPLGPFSLSRSSSRANVAAVLSRVPHALSIEHAREVLLEYILAQEHKYANGGAHHRASESSAAAAMSPGTNGPASGGSAAQGGPARGGKGTLSSAMFEDISGKLRDVENSLVSPDPQVLSLILSLRLSLSLFSTRELSEQLLLLPLRDAELALRMYVRRRLPGDGRWSCCKALEAMQETVCRTRPAIRSVIRTVRAKYLLPEQARHQVPLPAPSKSKCIAAIQAALASSGSPTSPRTAPLPPPYPQASPSSAVRPLEEPVAQLALEVLSEFLTREKRDYMRALKWTKSGRIALGKDLAEIEEKLVQTASGSGSVGRKGKTSAIMGGVALSPQQAALVPVFEALRTMYNLPPSAGSSTASRRPGLDYLPIPTLDEDEPYFPPSLQSVTSALYCNPRLSTPAAAAVLMELVEYERDVRVYPTGAGHSVASLAMDPDEGAWGIPEKVKMGMVLESIERRFPDGEYSEAFRLVARSTDCPPDMARVPSYKTIPDEAPLASTPMSSGNRGMSVRMVTQPTISDTASIASSSSISTDEPSPILRPMQSPPRTPTAATMFSTRSNAPSAPQTPAGGSTSSPRGPTSPCMHSRAQSLPISPQKPLPPQPSRRPTLHLDLEPNAPMGVTLVPPTAAPRLPSLDNGERPLSGLEDDFNEILAGYGDAIQPLEPTLPVGISTPPTSPPLASLRDLHAASVGEARGIPIASTATAPYSARTAPSSPYTPPASGITPPATTSGGRFNMFRTHSDRERPSMLHRRTNSSSQGETSGASPSPRSNLVRLPSVFKPSSPGRSDKRDKEKEAQSPQSALSPSKWRKEFMAKNMLQPSPAQSAR